MRIILKQYAHARRIPKAHTHKKAPQHFLAICTYMYKHARVHATKNIFTHAKHSRTHTLIAQPQFIV